MKKRRSTRRGAPLGQHFLKGQWAAARLAECIDVRPGETILEIGPGKGALTKELLKTGAHVIAVEKDPALVVLLNETFPKELQSGQFQLIENDIRDFHPTDYKLQTTNYVVAANIPYYITGEIIRKFLTSKNQPRAMALLIQKEVAERILGRRDEGRGMKESILSLSVKAYGTPNIVAKVGRGNFSPPPSVDSAILLVENVSRDFFQEIDEATFFALIRAGFSSKRKLLLRNLEKFGFTKPEFGACGIDEKARAEDVPLEKWKCLARTLGMEG